MTELQVRLELMAWPNLLKFRVDDAEAVSGGNQLDSTSDRKGIVLGETPQTCLDPPKSEWCDGQRRLLFGTVY